MKYTFKEKIYNKVFAAFSEEEEWDNWQGRISLEINEAKESGKLKELHDPTEIKYYSWLAAEIIDILLKDIKNIVEIGSGSGALSYYLSKATACRYTLVDNSKISMEYANLIHKENDFVKFVLANAIDLPFKENSFDFIHSTGLVEHFEDDKILLMIKEMKRVLKKDGYLFLAVPNYKSPDLLYLWKKHRKGSERNITKKDLKKFVEKNDLKIIKIGHSGFTFGDQYSNFIPRKLESFIGKIGFGFLNYIIVKKL